MYPPKGAEADTLYERFVKPLEPTHWGKMVAVRRDGRYIVGEDEEALVRAALENLGSGEFVLFRVGTKVVDLWRHTRS